MHNLRRILEHRWSFQQVTVMCFVDFASAFDSVDRDSLWQIMAANGMPLKLLRLVKAYYLSTKMKVRASGSDSMPFGVPSGVRQWCSLSPTLINNIIDWILRQALQDYPGVQVGANVCSNPRYSWVTYFILSNICNFSQLVLSILSTHPLFALSIFVTLSIFRRLIKHLSSSRPLLSIHFLRYLLTL